MTGDQNDFNGLSSYVKSVNSLFYQPLVDQITINIHQIEE